MPKTIAITPSWYWPSHTDRVAGTPPFRVDEYVSRRLIRLRGEDVVVCDVEQRLTASQLEARVAAAAASLRSRTARRAALVARPSADGLVALLALLRSGVPFHLIEPDGPSAISSGSAPVPSDAVTVVAGGNSEAPQAGTGVTLTLGDLLGGEKSIDESDAPVTERVVAVASGVDTAWHSHRSLLGGSVSLSRFLGVATGDVWLSTLAVSTWEGVFAALTPLVAGATVVFAPPGEVALDLIAREGVGTSVWSLQAAFEATRDAKKKVKTVRGAQTSVLLTVPGTFDPDERRRVAKLFEAPALTVWGMAECGPVFASHPSWYVDESVGIPITNAWVVPVDPRSLAPIPTLWELVESAMVTVWSPGLFEGYQGDTHPERFVDGRFVTGMMASQDANGMIYLLPD